jgi:hypothetical protein
LALFGQCEFKNVKSQRLKQGRTTLPTEQFRGDPVEQFDASPETLTLTDQQSDAIDEMVVPSLEESVPPDAQKDPKTLFAQFVIAAAGKEADDRVSRATDKARVTEYLNLFGLDFADSAGIPYAFCAAGLGFAACEGYCKMDPAKPFGDPPTSVFRTITPIINEFYFLPHPSCIKMVERAKAKGNWVRDTAVSPLPGWLVFYNWAGGASAEHVGIVETASSTTLRTIEFNTSIVVNGNQRNGGVVARKNRDDARRFVIGYIATHSLPIA